MLEEEKNMLKKNKNPRRKKKILLIVMISIVGVMLVLYGVTLFLEHRMSSKASEETKIDYRFWQVDFEENIYDDSEYVSLISEELFQYRDLTGVSIGIDRERAGEYNPEIRFFIDFLSAIIAGDYQNYNAMFSGRYYQNKTPVNAFTMQKVYDAYVSLVSVSNDSNGVSNYTKYEFILEYKILKNNGSFRKDIGNGSKKQHIVLTDREGKLKIDQIDTEVFQ